MQFSRKPKSRDRFLNRSSLKTRRTPLLGQINSDSKARTTKLRKVSSIRAVKTANAINQLPIKPLRAPLYTLTALPRPRREWRVTEVLLPLHSKGCKDLDFLPSAVTTVRGIMGAN